MLSPEDLELGFERYLELLLRDPAATAEFERSRAEFFADAAAALLPGAERRHLEWFLLERPSTVLGGVPVQAWQSAWRVSFGEASAELVAGFAHSLAGAFEVTSLLRGEGLWVRDLFTLGEHPVLESRASLEIEVGDLLVGRLFPAGGGAFLLSSAASLFRNPPLLAAVRVDLEGMRAARRGVLRVQQLELENLFHGPGSVEAAPPPTEEAFERARIGLAALGLEPTHIAKALAAMRRALGARDGAAVTELLNRLAFETGVDLVAARLVLAELWSSTAPAPPAGEVETDAETIRARDAQAALEAFDRGRAQGQDLEQLFRQLERDLGVEDDVESDEEASDDEAAGAPDFPGVIGAIVEEFLWELGLEQGEAAVRAFEPLRVLGRYAQDIGVFEELSRTRLVDFAARWLLDEGLLGGPDEAERMLDALTAFCRWCEERQGHALWKELEPTLVSLRSSLPRHVRLRRALSGPPNGTVRRVVRVAEDRARVQDGGAEELEVVLTPVQAAELRAGDLVRVARGPGAPALAASYPRELAELLPAS